MKKLFTIIIACLSVAIICCGCAGNTPQTNFDKPFPWIAHFIESEFKSETVTYKVVKYRLEGDDADNPEIPVTEDSSYMTYTISQDTENWQFVLTMDLQIVYNADSEYMPGTIDTIHSEAIFRADTTLAAVSTHKEVNLGSAYENSYSYTVNYPEGKATFSNYLDMPTDTPTKELYFDGKHSYIDNEYMFYYVRAMSTVGSSLNATFDILDWYSCFMNNKVSTTPISARYQENVNVITDNENLSKYLEQTEEEAETEEETKSGLKINSDTIRIMINSSDNKTGTPIYVSYTTAPFKNNLEASYKVISKISNFESIKPRILTHRTDFTISDFTVTP